MNILFLVRGRQERVKMSFLGESKSGRLKEKKWKFASALSHYTPEPVIAFFTFPSPDGV